MQYIIIRIHFLYLQILLKMELECPIGCKIALKLEDHNSESLLVCSKCGFSTPSNETLDGSADKDKTQFVFSNRNQLRKFTPQRKNILKLLRSSLSKVSISWSGLIGEKCRNLLDRVDLEGRNFDPDCVAGALIFVSLRDQRSEVTLDKLSKVLGVNPVEVNRVVKHLRRDKQINVKPRIESGLKSLIRIELKDAEFWTRDGSEVNNEEMFEKIQLLIEIFQNFNVQILTDKNLVVAAAFFLYKSDFPSRKRMKVGDFLTECNLQGFNASEVEAKSVVAFKCLKSLALHLPHLDKKECQFMKTNQVLSYLDDILQYKDFLLNRLQFEGRSEGKRELVDGEDEKSRREIPDEELDVDEYIRTPEEVKLIETFLAQHCD